MGVGQGLASSQYQHLIKELWRRFPLKVMIRIQHEERAAAAGLVKGCHANGHKVGGFSSRLDAEKQRTVTSDQSFKAEHHMYKLKPYKLEAD